MGQQGKNLTSKGPSLSIRAISAAKSNVNVFGVGRSELRDFSKFFAAPAKKITAIFPLTESRRKGDELFTSGLLAWEEGSHREAFSSWEKARKAYLQRLRYHGGDAETHYRLFDIAFKTGDMSEAERYSLSATQRYEQELGLNPSKDKIIYERMAEICGKMGWYDLQQEYQAEAEQISERGFGSYFAPF